MPSSIANDNDEKKLGGKLRNLKTKIKQYVGVPLEEIENEEDRRTVEIIRKLDEEYGLGVSLKNVLAIKAWCGSLSVAGQLYEGNFGRCPDA